MPYSNASRIAATSNEQATGCFFNDLLKALSFALISKIHYFRADMFLSNFILRKSSSVKAFMHKGRFCLPKPPARNFAEKVIFFNPSSLLYGSEISMLHLLDNLKFPTLVVCGSGGPLNDELAARRIEHRNMEFCSFSVRENPLWHVYFLSRILALLSMVRPRVVVINLDGNTPHIVLACKMLHIPVIRFQRLEFCGPASLAEKWALPRVDLTICPTDTVKRQLLEWMPHLKAVRLYESFESISSLETSSPPLLQKYATLTKANDLIAYIGRIDPAKRIEVALRAFEQLGHHMTCSYLLIIGSHDGSEVGRRYAAFLLDLTHELGISDRVIFTGNLPPSHVFFALKLFALCVQPSESESFGMTLIEAWANGVPTIASDVGGCRELTLNSGGGLLFPVGNDSDLAEKMLRLLKDKTEAYVLAKNGREWVQRSCCASAISKTFEELIDGLS
jgi:glycosyltransferase involved in cell wall biosynthesis